MTVFVSSETITSIPSSNRSERSCSEPSGMPYASDSITFHPAPMPSSKRPPEMWSIVAAMLAVTAGWRWCMPLTIAPSRRREVAWASAASIVQPSRFGPSYGSASG